MTSITKRTGENRWQARFRDVTGHEHAKRFSRKTDARTWLDEQTAALVTGQFVDPRSGRITVKLYATGWERLQIGRPATARIVDNALRLHVLPRLGSRPMVSVRRSDVQGLVTDLAATYAPGSVRNVYDVTARLFAAAVEDRIIALSPCKRIVLPRDEDPEIVAPTAQDVRVLVDAVAEEYRPLVVLLAGSGLRIGEALGLRRGDVDFLRKTVRVERQRLQEGNVGPTKTARSNRTVPLAQTVLDALAPAVSVVGADDYLWPLTYRQWRAQWRSALDATGLAWTTHDLRHFCASALISGGASVKQVQTVLGHSNAAITLRTYSHLWPGDDDRTRAVMEQTLSGLRTTCGQPTGSEDVSAGQDTQAGA